MSLAHMVCYISTGEEGKTHILTVETDEFGKGLPAQEPTRADAVPTGRRGWLGDILRLTLFPSRGYLVEVVRAHDVTRRMGNGSGSKIHALQAHKLREVVCEWWAKHPAFCYSERRATSYQLRCIGYCPPMDCSFALKVMVFSRTKGWQPSSSADRTADETNIGIRTHRSGVQQYSRRGQMGATVHAALKIDLTECRI